MTAAAAPDLAALDTWRPAPLEERVWAANLAALAAEDAELAAALQAVALPETWRPAWGLDDSLTFRIESPAEPAAWLGGTAAPIRRAQAVLGETKNPGTNIALPCLGAGGEVQTLLTWLAPHQCAFVFEQELTVLAAVLRARDWSEAIASGRCVLLPPGREGAGLATYLERYVGVGPPTNIILPEFVSAERMDEIKRVCEVVGTATNQRRSERLSRVRAHPWTPPAGSPRLAVLSLRPHAPSHQAADGLERAATKLGWAIRKAKVSGPRDVDALLHCETLHEFAPNVTLCVNHLRSALPLSAPERSCVWFVDERCVPEQLAQEDAVFLAGSPRIAHALVEAGVDAERIWPWYAAGDPDGQSLVTEEWRPEPYALLVGDLPDVQPKTYGITASAHQRLWGHLQTVAAKAWDTPRIMQPDKLLAQAQRDCAVEITDAHLQSVLVRLVERVVVPAAILEQVVRTLTGLVPQVRALGVGWERLEARGVRPLAHSLIELSDAPLRPRACIFAGQVDPLTPTLVQAAAMGWPLVLHDAGGRTLRTALGGVFGAQQHFEAFADSLELRRALQFFSATPAKAAVQCVRRAQQHVWQQHSFEARLRELAGRLNLASA